MVTETSSAKVAFNILALNAITVANLVTNLQIVFSKAKVKKPKDNQEEVAMVSHQLLKLSSLATVSIANSPDTELLTAKRRKETLQQDNPIKGMSPLEANPKSHFLKK
jgi:hypothetical protein